MLTCGAGIRTHVCMRAQGHKCTYRCPSTRVQPESSERSPSPPRPSSQGAGHKPPGDPGTRCGPSGAARPRRMPSCAPGRRCR